MKTTIKSIITAALCAVGLAAAAAESVTINEVTENNGTWSKIDVKYTLSGVDTAVDYQVQFDVTADGETKSVTNDTAKLGNSSYTKTIDTTALFGSAKRDAKAKVKVSLIKTAIDVSQDVQLWENGPVWASCNVGASKPEEYGYYFWWGDTVGYVRNPSGTGWNSSDGTKIGFEFDSDITPTYYKTIAELYQDGYIDANSEDGKLKLEHDAARHHRGGTWRMPTRDEIGALVENCEYKWITLNGIDGYLVRGKGDYASKAIFLPAAGFGEYGDLTEKGQSSLYWSSTPSADVITQSYYLSSFHGKILDSFELQTYSRDLGHPIRPVK